MDSMQRDVTGWVGWIVFAAVIMVMMGVFSIIGGLIAIFDDSWGEGALGQYAESTANTWGWTALIIGVLVLFAAFGILQGKTWARVVAIVLVGLEAIAHFGTVRGYPIWSMIVIILCVFVLYALIVHGRELRTDT
jgi:ABC-type multidrug transport system fused ATPase/permease subunit